MKRSMYFSLFRCLWIGIVTSFIMLSPAFAHLTKQSDNTQRPFRFYVWLYNGAIHGYDLEERPMVTLGETEFTLTTTRMTMTYQATDILRFTLQDEVPDDPSSVTPVFPKLDNVQFREGTLFISDGVPNAAVHVYDMDGRTMQATKTDEEGNLSLSLVSLRSGIYIISTDKTKIKIQKK